MSIERQLIDGRACGGCNVCCVALTIDDPALRKAQGYRCHNAQPDGGCAIYATRPETCRTFYCGWRLLRWVGETLRPDVSDVLVRLKETSPADGRPGYSVAFTLLTAAGLDAEGLAESVAASVAAGIPTYLIVQGKPGFTGAEARINDLLEPAVRARDKAGVLALLRDAHALGSQGPRARIVMR